MHNPPHVCTHRFPQKPCYPATQVLGPDVEYIISRAQAIQQGNDSSVLTAEHLQQAISSLQGGAGAAAGDGGLTKEDLEATMKQMLMVSRGVGLACRLGWGRDLRSQCALWGGQVSKKNGVWLCVSAWCMVVVEEG
jgi:hypothetical protein